jgi:fatty-acyl-CoA synthase
MYSPLLIGKSLVALSSPGGRAALAATLGAEEITFGELDSAANRFARVLQRHGVAGGDIVMWWTGAALSSLSGMLACARLGAVFAPLSVLLDAEGAADIASYVRPRLLVCDLERVDAAARLGEITVLGLGELEHAAGMTDKPIDDVTVSDRDPHILYLTSGSTGRPKGVLVSHRASWLRSAPDGNAPGVDGVLCTFPLYHYGGWHYVIEAWLAGTAVHLVSRADGSEVTMTVERRRPQAIYCIPAVWERVLATDGDLSSLRYADTGTSSFGDSLLDRLGDRLPKARTRVLYGASEAGRMAALEHSELADHRGSVGRSVSHGRITLSADGEVVFSGPTLMNGYLNLPDATATAIDEHGYRTGDLGWTDEDGFLYITGRRSEAIRTGGEWVSPVEVEAAIRNLPGVADLAVIGVPDPQCGEIVCVALVPEAGHVVPSADELRARLIGLARYKQPRLVVEVPDIPRTAATGQIMRKAIQATIVGTLAVGP